MNSLVQKRKVSSDAIEPLAQKRLKVSMDAVDSSEPLMGQGKYGSVSADIEGLIAKKEQCLLHFITVPKDSAVCEVKPENEISPSEEVVAGLVNHDSTNSKADLVDYDSSDSEAEPINELEDRSMHLSPDKYQQYESDDWTSSDWEEEFECTDWTVHAGPSSNAVEYTVGESFEDKKQLQQDVKQCHIKNGRQCKTSRSCSSLIVFKCIDDSCYWSLRATQEFFGGWRITKLGSVHSCPNSVPIKHHRQLDCKLIFELIYPYVKRNNGIRICDLQQVVKGRCKHMPTYKKVWYAKYNVIEHIYGSPESDFEKFPRYMVAIKHYNPGTVFDYEFKCADGQGSATFSKWFWAYASSIQGFPHCRPLISIDSTHLYGRYTGKLLVAVTYDADNEILPLAFTLCDNESTETWTWFLERLRQYVIKDARKVCIISDSNKDIRVAVQEVFPEPHGVHRYCARHLTSDFNNLFKNKKLTEHFEEMVWTSNKQKFLRLFEEFNESDEGKYKSFIASCGHFNKWSLSHDGGHRYGVMTTDHSEIFNKVLKNARSLPVTALLEVTFLRMNDYQVSRMERYVKEALEGHIFIENIRGYLREADEASMSFTATTLICDVKFNIDNRDGENYVVDLQLKECECGEFTLFGRPCKHAMCAIRAAKADVAQFVDPQFGIGHYVRTYAHSFKPLRQKHNWPEWEGPTVIVDPKMLISGNWRKGMKIHNERDASQTSKNKCGKCGQQGHNKRTCTTNS